MSDEGKDVEGAAKPAESRGWRLVNFDWLTNPPTAVAATVYVIATLFALAVFVLVGFGLFASFQIAYETAIGKFPDRIEAAKVFFPILLALVGGPLLIWRVITAHIQAQATRHQAETGREAHYTSLFTRAVEQLGATRDESDGAGQTVTKPNLEVRLGAIYALERIAQDSERDHWPIMEVLCAYVRNPQNCGPPPKRPDKILVGTEEYMSWIATLAPHVDVQAALSAIGRRRSQQEGGERSLDLSRTALQDTTLYKLNFERANFRRSYLEAIAFNEARLTRALFIEASLAVVFFDKADLRGSFFSNVRIDSGFFDDTDLSETWFDRASLHKSYFRRAKLTSAVFDNAFIFEGSFSGTDMTKASFNQVHLTDVDFLNATLAGATFFHTDLSNTAGLTSEQIATAIGDASTILPERQPRPAHWPGRTLNWKEREELITQVRNEQSGVQRSDGAS